MDPPFFPPRQNALKCGWILSAFHSSSSHPLCFSLLPPWHLHPHPTKMLSAPALGQLCRAQLWLLDQDGALWGQAGGELESFPGPLCDTPSASTDFLYKFIYFKLIFYCHSSSQEGCPVAGGRGSKG